MGSRNILIGSRNILMSKKYVVLCQVHILEKQETNKEQRHEMRDMEERA